MYKTSFQENDFVWAKMAGHPFWPAIICNPAENAANNNMQWVYFLGSHNYGWIEDNDKKIKPYEINKSKYWNKRCETAMKELDEIIECFVENPNYQFTFPTCTPKSKSVSKKPRKKYTSRVGRKRASSAMSADSVNSNAAIEDVPKLKKKFVPHETAEIYYLNNDDNNENNEEDVRVETVANAEEETLINDLHIVNTTTIITASEKIFAFLADDGVLCQGIVKNLLKSGHCIHFYSDQLSQRKYLRKYAQDEEADFTDFDSMQEAVRDCDIVLSCMDNTKTADGIVEQFEIDSYNNLLNEKIYVQMSSIDVKTSRSLKEKLEEKGAIYFEAMLQGTKIDAETANLMVLAAGSKELYLELQSCFKSIAKTSFLLGDVGVASSLHPLLQMIRGSFLAALCEGFSLAERFSLSLRPFSTIFKETSIAGDYLSSKADAIEKKQYLFPKDANEPVDQLQNDIAKGLDLANTFNHPMPLISKANEFFKQARRMGSDSLDSACIFRSGC